MRIRGRWRGGSGCLTPLCIRKKARPRRPRRRVAGFLTGPPELSPSPATIPTIPTGKGVSIRRWRRSTESPTSPWAGARTFHESGSDPFRHLHFGPKGWERDAVILLKFPTEPQSPPCTHQNDGISPKLSRKTFLNPTGGQPRRKCKEGVNLSQSHSAYQQSKTGRGLSFSRTQRKIAFLESFTN